MGQMGFTDQDVVVEVKSGTIHTTLRFWNVDFVQPVVAVVVVVVDS
jgi:hypothetical protein